MAVAVLAAACSSTGASKASNPPSSASPTTASGPLQAPKTTPTQDAAYFTDLAKVDPDLSTYVNSEQSVALQALLTDGAAFCAFLKRGGDIDNAMESVVIGANSVESQTHLPASVKTYNSIDAVALVALCPSEQALLPASDQARIQSLSKTLDAG